MVQGGRTSRSARSSRGARRYGGERPQREAHGQGRGHLLANEASEPVRAEYVQGLRFGLEYATKGTNTVNGHKIERRSSTTAGVDPAKAPSAAKDLIGQGYKIITVHHLVGHRPKLGALAAQNWSSTFPGLPPSTPSPGPTGTRSDRGGRLSRTRWRLARTLGSEKGRQDPVFGQTARSAATTRLRERRDGWGESNPSAVLCAVGEDSPTAGFRQVKEAAGPC